MKIAILAGETSGDILGADLMSSLIAKDVNIEFIGVGGRLMEKLGLKSEFPMERLSVMGIWPILQRLPELLIRRKKLAKYLIEQKVDCFIGIDAPEFNLGLELMLKKVGIKTVHYVSPSVWAWREKRIFKIKKAVDLMLTLLPFEIDIYKRHQISARFVGHSLAMQIPLLSKSKDEEEKLQARAELCLSKDSKLIAVMPGSRGSEVKYLGEVFLKTIQLINNQYPDWQFVVPCANEKRLSQWKEQIERIPVENCLTVLGQSHQAMRASDAILMASGTASLEGLLINRPMVVAYKVSNFSYQIFKRLLKINSFSLPNLLANKTVVKEFIQEDCQENKLAEAVQSAIESPHQHHELFNQIHQQLSCQSGDLAAEAIFNLIKKEAV